MILRKEIPSSSQQTYSSAPPPHPTSEAKVKLILASLIMTITKTCVATWPDTSYSPPGRQRTALFTLFQVTHILGHKAVYCAKAA
jgi:hypothetical protein